MSNFLSLPVGICTECHVRSYQSHKGERDHKELQSSQLHGRHHQCLLLVLNHPWLFSCIPHLPSLLSFFLLNDRFPSYCPFKFPACSLEPYFTWTFEQPNMSGRIYYHRFVDNKAEAETHGVFSPTIRRLDGDHLGLKSRGLGCCPILPQYILMISHRNCTSTGPV